MQPTSLQLAGKWLLILALPLAEILIFLTVSHPGPIHYGLRLKFLDLLLPLPTAFFVLMFLLERAVPCERRFQIKALLFNLAVVALAVLWQPSLPLMILGVLSAFCVWVEPSYYLKNPNRLSIVPCAVLAFSVAIYLNIPDHWLGAVGTLTSDVTGFIVARLFGGGMEASTTSGAHLMLKYGPFLASVGKPCWGLDGFFFFTVIFLLVTALFRKSLRFGRWFVGYFLGLTMMFFLNILRVLLLVNVGAWAQTSLGTQAGNALVQSLVHPHLGWLLYTPAMLLFFPLGLRLSSRENEPLSALWNETFGQLVGLRRRSES